MKKKIYNLLFKFKYFFLDYMYYLICLSIDLERSDLTQKDFSRHKFEKKLGPTFIYVYLGTISCV